MVSSYRRVLRHHGAGLRAKREHATVRTESTAAIAGARKMASTVKGWLSASFSRLTEATESFSWGWESRNLINLENNFQELVASKIVL